MGIFRTKLDFSDNRQVKQRIETTTNLSGATTFGVPFSDLPTGPNPTLSSITQTIYNVASTFSGNNTTTIFTWGDNRMILAESALSAITPSNSATTQNTGNFFTPDISSAVVIDGYTAYTSYTGVSYDVKATTFTDLGGGNYSGNVTTIILDILGTAGIDFTGRTIWNDVSGISRTNRLIITDSPQIGYVWTCIDSEGMGEWQYNGSSSASTFWEETGNSNTALKDIKGVHIITGDSTNSMISGGKNNEIDSSKYSGIFAGYRNKISGGGSGNTYNMILGGFLNTIDNHANSFIIGGSGNTIHFDLDDIAVENNFESIINSRDCVISASTNVEISNSFDVSIGDNILSSIRNSAAMMGTTEITGNYSNTNSSGLNLIDNSIDAIISGYTIRTSIIGSQVVNVLGTYSGGNSYGNTVMGSFNVGLGTQPGTVFENVETTTLGSGSIIYERNNKTLIGASNQITSLTGGYLTVLATRTANLENAYYSSILGGRNQTLTNVDYSSIVGGSGHTLYYSDYSSIVGGAGNKMSGGTKSAILGGQNSLINSSDYSGIFAGLNNQIGLGEPGFNANAQAAVILGGNSNIIYEALASSSILGGSYNEIHKYNNNTSIIGGEYNSISGVSVSSGIFAGSGNTITNLSNYSSILGGKEHTLTNVDYSTIVGGSGHTISNSSYSGIFGGAGNKILYNSSYGWGTIMGGNNNVVAGASNYFAIIGGGNNAIGDSNSALITTESSEITASMDYSAILAGTNHEMTTDVYTGPANTVILGGNNSTYRNTGIIGLNNSAMIGGNFMSITGVSNMNLMSTSNESKMLGTISYNTMIGNDNCEINIGSQSTIISSDQSRLKNVVQSTLFGTFQSTISGTSTVTSALILGGEKHSITGPAGTADYSSIINGSTNNIKSAKNAVIIGGSNVRISGNSDQSVAILSKDSYIDGTSVNSGLYSTELSLITNSSNLSTITGGYINRILSSNYSSVLGGSQNIISGSSSFYNSIIGGLNNRVFDTTLGTSIISSSNSKIYPSQYSVILGGYQNIISGITYSTEYNTILGGTLNVISGISLANSSVLGGSGNVLTGTRSAIIGGQNIIGTANDTVYVPDLVIDGLTNSTTLGTNANGKIVDLTSDARLKQNVNGLNNSLNVIKNLRGVSFEYTPESEIGGGVRYGFIAQEVQQHVPDIVRLRAKGDGMLSLNYDEIVPILVEAVKELSSGVTTSNNTHLETQTILAEDNNIELNFNGTQQTAIGGGLTVLHAKGQDQSANLITDANGNFVTNNDFKPQALTIPLYTPTSSNDEAGTEGNITRDDNYMYVKTSTGWKRTNLENF